jgi:nicotinamide-nucleotide amidase
VQTRTAVRRGGKGLRGFGSAPRAECIAVGSELLAEKAETNSRFLIEELGRLGFDLRLKTVVGDRENDIEEVLSQALHRSDVIILTGGLGPAEDDLTKKVVARVLKRRLVFQEAMRKRFQEASVAQPRLKWSERQALIPTGASVLPNPLGMVSGLLLEEGGRIVIALPGTPAEVEAVFADSVRPHLEERFPRRKGAHVRILRTTGLSETEVAGRIRDLRVAPGRVSIQLASSASSGRGVDLRLAAEGEERGALQALDAAETTLRDRLGLSVYGEGEQELEEVVGLILTERRLTLAVAESCTGGLLAQRITNVPGSSRYFDRGVVCYSNASKTALLDLSPRLLELHGSVSREVAGAMAEGVRFISGTTLGLGVTGIAGPSGATPAKPVGLVYGAVAGLPAAAGRGETRVEEWRLEGDRRAIREQATQRCLDLLRRALLR